MDRNNGKHLIQVEDDLIILTLNGEFSERSVQAYASDIQVVVEGFKGKPFLLLVDNLALKGATPEAYEESNKHNRWLSETNMVGKATVYHSSFFADVDSARVISKKLLNCRNFDTVNAAQKWLSNLKHESD